MEPHTGFNNFDYAIFGVILLSGLLALMRGFVREVVALLVWTGAIIIAFHYYLLGEPFVHQYVKEPNLANIISGVCIFCLSFIVLSLIGYGVCKIVRGGALTAIDRSLGFLFGLFRGVLVVCLAYLLVAAFLWPDIDKPTPPAEPQSTAQVQTQPASQAQAQPPTPAPKEKPIPEWLAKARTRPFIALGAEWMKQFVPEKQIEKTTEEYLDKKSTTQHMMDQQTLDTLSTMGIGSSHIDTHGYDDKSRSNVDQLIDEKVKQ
jgi:membrane protein required for colicin V production